MEKTNKFEVLWVDALHDGCGWSWNDSGVTDTVEVPEGQEEKFFMDHCILPKFQDLYEVEHDGNTGIYEIVSLENDRCPIRAMRPVEASV